MLYGGGSLFERRGKPWLGDSPQMVFESSGRAGFVIDLLVCCAIIAPTYRPGLQRTSLSEHKLYLCLRTPLES